MMVEFAEVFTDSTKFARKIKNGDYLDKGTYPIIDQGQVYVVGYTNDVNGIFNDVPAIIFGDHTRIIKYIDKPFFIGADGVKILKSKIDNSDYKYLYYALRNKKIANTGYNRHFKWLKESKFNLPSLVKQKEIASILGYIESIIDIKNKQLLEYDQLIKSRFVEMFVDKYEKIKVSAKLKTTSGGTPKSDKSEYYINGTIPWLTSGEVNQGRIEKTDKYITQKGLENSSAKWISKKSIVIAMYGATAGKVGIIEMPTTTNQAVCAVLPHDEYNPEYLRFAFEYISDELAGKAVGGGQPNISQAIIKNSLIFNPPLEVQNNFSMFVQQVDKLKFAVQQSLNETQTLFDSLMHRYFG